MRVFNTETFKIKASKLYPNYNFDKTIYKSNITLLTITCPLHGDFKIRPKNLFVNGNKCKKCSFEELSSRIKCSTEKFIEKSKLIHKNTYDYSKVDYKNNVDKVTIICPIHKEFLQSPTHHTSGMGCPKCKSSKGERKIRHILLDNNIDFEEQKRFNNCSGKKPYPFDFYLPKYNLLIEYQGEQHFIKPRNNWGQDLEKRKLIDNLKEQFALNNGYNFLAITYKENITNKLTNHLKLKT